MQHFAEKLKAELGKGLPGTEVQWEMASSDRMVRGFPKKRNLDSLEGAVLILLYPIGNKISTVFIQRPVYDGVHSGQISLPGGKKEKADEDLIRTAIREACEETGIKSEIVNIIGTLTPLFIQVSNIEVTPVIAWTPQRPMFYPEKGEVEFLVEAGLEQFNAHPVIKSMPFGNRGEELSIKCYESGNSIIWGATLMIIHELMVVLKRGMIDIEV